MAAIIRKLNKTQCMSLLNIALKNNNGLSRMVMSTQVDVKTANGNGLVDTKVEKSKPIHVTSHMIFDREDKYGAHNYHPIPVALCKGKGEEFINYNYLVFLKFKCKTFRSVYVGR